MTNLLGVQGLSHAVKFLGVASNKSQILSIVPTLIDARFVVFDINEPVDIILNEEIYDIELTCDNVVISWSLAKVEKVAINNTYAPVVNNKFYSP